MTQQRKVPAGRLEAPPWFKSAWCYTANDATPPTNGFKTSRSPPADSIGPLCPRREFCNRPVQLASPLRVNLHARATPLSTLAAVPQLGRRKRLWTLLALTVLPPVHCSCSHAANMPATPAAAAVAQTRGNTSCRRSLDRWRRRTGWRQPGAASLREGESTN